MIDRHFGKMIENCNPSSSLLDQVWINYCVLVIDSQKSTHPLSNSQKIQLQRTIENELINKWSTFFTLAFRICHWFKMPWKFSVNYFGLSIRWLYVYTNRLFGIWIVMCIFRLINELKFISCCVSAALFPFWTVKFSLSFTLIFTARNAVVCVFSVKTGERATKKQCHDVVFYCCQERRVFHIHSENAFKRFQWCTRRGAKKFSIIQYTHLCSCGVGSINLQLLSSFQRTIIIFLRTTPSFTGNSSAAALPRYTLRLRQPNVLIF